MIDLNFSEKSSHVHQQTGNGLPPDEKCLIKINIQQCQAERLLYSYLLGTSILGGTFDNEQKRSNRETRNQAKEHSEDDLWSGQVICIIHMDGKDHGHHS